MRLDGSASVVMPEEVLLKIKYLCNAISQDEWSGVLFYKPKGEIYETGFSIDLVDIYLMDKGNPVHTAYNFTEDPTVVNYMMDNPHLMECKMGHVHSHNSMDVFFSGEDMDELNDNTEFHNYYLSLIVNNKMEFKAKVAFRGKSTVENVFYTCLTADGTEYDIPGLPINKEVMFLLDCTINSPNVLPIVPVGFMDRVTAIIEKAKRVFTGNKPVTGGATYNPNTAPYGTGGRTIPIQPNHIHKDDLDMYSMQDDVEDAVMYSDTEEWSCYLLRLGNTVQNDRLTEVLEDIDMSIKGMIHPRLNIDDFSASMLEMYVPLYEKYFDIFGVPDQDERNFIITLESTITDFEEYEGEFTFLSKLIASLKGFLRNYTSPKTKPVAEVQVKNAPTAKVGKKYRNKK